MFADNTLTPKEAIRLCALGLLAVAPKPYAALAIEIRHFVGRVVGPTPEVMGHSIELLKYEGLVEPVAGSGDAAILRLTDAGQAAMRQLLMANVRAHSSELNKLVVALKFRFLHLLSRDEQCLQVALLADATERELARLLDLRASHGDEPGLLVDWLDHDISVLEQRLAWLAGLGARLRPPAVDAAAE
jgi:DNA-binding PadR family transcriptional regulator